jgi:hypothetical protein
VNGLVLATREGVDGGVELRDQVVFHGQCEDGE